MAECHPSKVDVAGSNPVSRSETTKDEGQRVTSFRPSSFDFPSVSGL